MTKHRLEKLFSPSSIAVIGASDNRNSVGMKVFKNLLKENFQGKLYPVNVNHSHIQGEICFKSVTEIKSQIDLAIIATPATTVPGIIQSCGEKKIPMVILLSSGFSEIGDQGKKREKEILSTAQKYNIRLMGPNCLGIMRPPINMNASFDNNFALSGSLAFVSQSGALSAGMLDWAMERNIGFSTIVSLGNSADIDFGDIIDYLACDRHTKSILLYIEGIRNAPHFMRALRNASRVKPIIAIKAGKNQQGSRAALSHTGALIGSDDVFDVALRRAGVVRVSKIEDLFSVAELLVSSKKLKGHRLGIITNGGGAGVMAADRAYELGVDLPILSDNGIAELNRILPTQWSHQNPIDIIGDATPDRYHSTIEVCKKESDFDGILTILVPVAMANPIKVAKQVVSDMKKYDKLAMVCWMGEKHVKSSWKLFEKNKIPYFFTPEKAVEAFSYLARYNQNQELLIQTLPSDYELIKPDIKHARSMIDFFYSQNRTILTSFEAKKLLALFGIPFIETREADTLEKAINAANLFGFPVAMKINSPDILHKSQAGGVFLDIKNTEELTIAYQKIISNAKMHYPKSTILGVTIEPQYQNKFDRELMIGVINDIVFGPVISFGAGGTLVEIFKDRALELPPLNYFVANQLIQKTRVLQPSGKLRELSDKQKNHIITILLSVSKFVCTIPNIKEMDINPFILNDDGMIAVDARIILLPEKNQSTPYQHLAIRPHEENIIP